MVGYHLTSKVTNKKDGHGSLVQIKISQLIFNPLTARILGENRLLLLLYNVVFRPFTPLQRGGTILFVVGGFIYSFALLVLISV